MFKISDLNELIIKPFPWFLPIFNKWNFNFLKRNSKWKRNFRSKITFPRNFYFCGVERAPQLRNNFWPINSVIFLVKRKYPPKKKKNKKSTPTFVVCVLEPSTLRLCENIPTCPPFLSAMVPLVGSMDQNVVRFFSTIFPRFFRHPTVELNSGKKFKFIWNILLGQFMERRVKSMNFGHLARPMTKCVDFIDRCRAQSQPNFISGPKKKKRNRWNGPLVVRWMKNFCAQWMKNRLRFNRLCVDWFRPTHPQIPEKLSPFLLLPLGAFFGHFFFFPPSKDVKRAAQLSKLLRAFRPILFQSRALNSVGSVFIEGSTWLVTYTQINRPLDDRHHFIHSRIIQLLI